MRRRLRLSSLLVVAALAACGTDGTAPSSVIETRGGPPLLLGDLPIFVEVLQRSTALPRTYTAEATIGSGGGVIVIPEAGFRMDVPAGALRAPTRMTVKAVAGRNVAYEFAPHGLRFTRPATVTQDLRGTAAYGTAVPTLEGAYAPSLLGLLFGLLRVLETRPTTVQTDTWQMRFTVEHFSAYVASKRRSGYISASGDLIPRDD